jgi:hypothetical protein
LLFLALRHIRLDCRLRMEYNRAVYLIYPLEMRWPTNASNHALSGYWMNPTKQFRATGGTVDERSDVSSLGARPYEMARGSRGQGMRWM